METKHFEKDEYRNVDGIMKVVRRGLCHRCGACIGMCPAGTYEADENAHPKQVRDCIYCNICVQVCSGLAVDYETLGEKFYHGDYKFGSLMGPVRAAYVGNCTDESIRQKAASGGVITGLLVHLLETGQIKGALVTVGNPREPSQGMGIIARTREQLLESAQSRYTTAPSLSALLEIKDEEGPFALVGLPCQVHSLRKRQVIDPRWRKRIPLVIGLLCHYNIPFTATKEAAEMLAPKGAHLVKARSRERDERGWPHNTLELTFSDGSKWRSPVGPAPTFNVLSRCVPLGRCLTCMDATAEFADFSIGDPWIRDEFGNWKYDVPGGRSAVLVRTDAGEEALQDAVAAGKLELKPIPAHEVEQGQHAMMSEKKRRVAIRLHLRKRFGLAVPRYTVPLATPTGEDVVKEIRFWFTRLIGIWKPVRRLFMRLGFSRFGVYMIDRRIAKRRRQAARRRAFVSDSDFGGTTEHRQD